MVLRLLVGQIAGLGVGRKTANAHDLACHVERHHRLLALVLVDDDDGAVLLRELRRRQRPCVFHDDLHGLVAELAFGRSSCRDPCCRARQDGHTDTLFSP